MSTQDPKDGKIIPFFSLFDIKKLVEYSGEETVNLFIYPLLEIGDEPSTSFTKHFSYKNI